MFSIHNQGCLHSENQLIKIPITEMNVNKMWNSLQIRATGKNLCFQSGSKIWVTSKYFFGKHSFIFSSFSTPLIIWKCYKPNFLNLPQRSRPCAAHSCGAQAARLTCSFATWPLMQRQRRVPGYLVGLMRENVTKRAWYTIFKNLLRYPRGQKYMSGLLLIKASCVCFTK